MGDAVPGHELTRLRQAVTGRPASSLLVDPTLTPEQSSRLAELVARRRAGEPLQYLEGSVPFGGVEISVDRRALIPRPETEELFEIVAGTVDAPRVIVDLGTGSGNLALALAHRFPGAVVYATDISEAALELAAENAARLGLPVELLHGDLFEPLPETIRGEVDLLVSNPPYVAEDADLPPVVRDHEPAAALFAGRDGLTVIRELAARAASWVSPSATIAIEVGSDHASVAAALFEGFDVAVIKDLYGLPRFVIGRMIGSSSG